MSAAQFDDAMANLTAYITYMSDPTAIERRRLGVWVMLYLCVFFALAWWLNKTYWKDIK
ncbi:MAG: cytochrome c1 [Betaproteobacteria bacterium]|nr:cytochrome c1 [Betaproteobacteria bacterium]